MNNTLEKKAFIASGFSMFPFILPGSRLLIGKVEPKDVKVGDVVCYPSKKQQMMAHRVVNISDHNNVRIFVIKGDASFIEEEIPSSALAYSVHRVEHRFLSYDTDRLLGIVVARMAVSAITLSTSYRLALRGSVFFAKKSMAIKHFLSTKIGKLICII